MPPHDRSHDGASRGPLPLPLVEPLVKKFGCVAKVSADGEKQALFMDATGEHVRSVASAHQHGRKLFLGNLMGAGVSVLDLEDGE